MEVVIMSTTLTLKLIKSLTYSGSNRGQHCVWDTVVRCFGVRAYPGGQKSWVVRLGLRAGRRVLTIGRVEEMSLGMAREQASALLGKSLLVHSVIPGVARITFKEMAGRYLELHAKQHKKSWREDERMLTRDILPVLGSREIHSITTLDLVSLHSSLPKYQGNRVIVLVKTIYNKAKTWKLYEGENPAVGVKLNREVSRDRFVSQAEMPALLAAIMADENIHVRTCLLLYLLTGLRKSELLGLDWSSVLWSEKMLRIEKSKSGKPQFTPLSDYAIQLLQKLEEPCTDRIFPFQDIRKHWERIRKNAGLDDIRLHDLRRTFASWLAISGHSLHLIGQALHHTQQSTTAIYARLQTGQISLAMNEHSRKISGLSGLPLSQSLPSAAQYEHKLATSPLP